MKKILMSACFAGQKVRYDGCHSLLEHPLIQKWKAEGRLISFCPEIAGGLSVPRAPAEIQSHHPVLVLDNNQKDVTSQFVTGAEVAVDYAKRENVCCALLKSRSPSCGNREVYNGAFDGTIVPGAGVTAAELQRYGIPVFNEHEIDQIEEFIANQAS